MECGVYQLVRDIRPVELRGIDVVHARCHRVAEDGQRAFAREGQCGCAADAAAGSGHEADLPG